MKILLLTDKYFPSPLANAICAQNVADAFLRKGSEVDIIAFKDTKIKGESQYHSMNVYYIKPTLRTRLFYYTKNFPNSRYFKIFDLMAKILNRSKKLLMLPFYPIDSIVFPYKVYSLIKKLYEENEYDLILSVYKPFDNALASYWFKRKHSEVKWCLYTVDTFINHRYSFLKKRGNDNKWLYKFLDCCDMFIYMRSRENEYGDNRFSKWKSKMFKSDIPCMMESDIECSNNRSEKEIWVYAGALYAPHYKADDLIEYFLALPDDKERVLYFYSSGKELEDIKHFETETNGKIICHNYVPHDELLEIYKQADILVSMKYTAQISAKIFEYMSYRKPIIHFSGCEDDPNAEYVAHYELGCVIRLSKDHRTNMDLMYGKIMEWRQIDKTKEVDLSYFEMNLPEYTANLIENEMNKV